MRSLHLPINQTATPGHFSAAAVPAASTIDLEAGDLQNAVWGGIDAGMLSGEAASGDFPVQLVRAEVAAAFEAESVKHLLRECKCGATSVCAIGKLLIET